MRHRNTLSRVLLGKSYTDLEPAEQEVIGEIARKRPLFGARKNAVQDSLGDRLADRIAAFGGSWRFILISVSVLAFWVLLNAFILAKPDRFDPYPFVFLNLMLSMVAALQAPVIMMSQNRQSATDRLAAANGYEVNLRAELEITELHLKIDALTEMVARLSDEEARRLDGSDGHQ